MVRNMSKMFGNQILGREHMSDEDAEHADEEAEKIYNDNSWMAAMSDINFEDKVMGGESINMMDGMMPNVSGRLDYAKRINNLTKTGGSIMEQDDDDNENNNVANNNVANNNVANNNGINKMQEYSLNSNSMDNKIPMMSKLNGGVSGNAKMPSGMLDMNASKKNVGSMLGTSDNFNKKAKSLNDNFKIPNFDNMAGKSFNGTGSQFVGGDNMKAFNPFGNVGGFKKTEFKNSGSTGGSNPLTSVGGVDTSKKIKDEINGAFNADFAQKNLNRMSGGMNFNNKNLNLFNNMNVNSKINQMSSGMDINNKISQMSNNKSNINMKNYLGNPGEVAKKRLRQQEGLSMYGDRDNDGLMNALDCDPLNPNEQGNQHNLNRYMGNVESDRGSGRRDDLSFVKQNVNNLGERAKSSVQQGAQNLGRGVKSSVKRGYQKLTGSSDDKYAQPFYENGETTKSEAYYENGDEQDNGSGVKAEGRNIGKIKKRINPDDSQSVPEVKPVDVTGMSQSSQDDFLDTKIAEVETQLNQGGLGKQEREELRKTHRHLLSQKSRGSGESQLKATALQEETKRMKEKGQLELQKRQADIEQTKGDTVRFEKQLQAGKSIMGDLTGAGEGMKDASSLTGVEKGRVENAPESMSNITGVAGTNSYNMAESVGEQNISGGDGFHRISQALGGTQSSKPWTSKVQESVSSRTSPEDVMREREQQQRMAEQRAMETERAPQPQLQPQPQAQPQPETAQSQQQQSRQGGLTQHQIDVGRAMRGEINWDEVEPEEAAKVDPEYADYLKKSDASYRRGPYKK